MRRLVTWCIAIGVLLGLCGCSGGSPEGFQLFLATEDVTTIEAMATDIQHITLAPEPMINLDDIVSYAEEWHEILLTEDAYARLQRLNVPVTGWPFVVCAGSERIYVGALWTPISSIMFDGITIWQPLGRDDQMIRIEFGYPSDGYGAGDDARSDPLLMDALREAGKLQ